MTRFSNFQTIFNIFNFVSRAAANYNLRQGRASVGVQAEAFAGAQLSAGGSIRGPVGIEAGGGGSAKAGASAKGEAGAKVDLRDLTLNAGAQGEGK